MASVDSVHHKGIHKRQNDEDKDGPLLGKPKTEREPAEMELIERLNEDDAKEVGNNKPEG